MGAPQPIIRPGPRLLTRIARELEITNAKTKVTTKWEPTDQQIRFWETLYEHRLVFALKARQIYFTTAGLLFDAVFTVINTQRGNRVETWLIWDTDEKVREKVADIAEFLRQMSVQHKHVDGDAKIIIPRFDEHNRPIRPSIIRGFTAGSKRTAASLTATLVHCSETPYWADPDKTSQSLGPTIGAGGYVYHETTMAAASKMCRTMWDRRNMWTPGKLFVSCQDHKAYRLDPSDCRPEDDRKRHPDAKMPLPADVEDKLREEGFTNRRAMAYVYYVYLNLMGEDWTETLREYPQLPRHCFDLASGRWIRVRPKVLPYRVHHASSTLGRRKQWLKVFIEPEHTSGQLVIGVDTAGKSGRSRSAVAVIDKKDGRLAASWAADLEQDTDMIDLVDVTEAAQKLYTQHSDLVWGEDDRLISPIPPAVIELNGPGNGTMALAKERGLHVVGYDTNEGSNSLGLQMVREYAEKGILCGPEELREESDSLRREQRNEDAPIVWKGLKDLCMACSAAYVYRRDHPYREAAEGEGSSGDFFDLAKRAGW